MEGLRELIRKHVSLAQQLASWVADSAEFELVAPHPLTLVCFRHQAGDHASQAVLEGVNATGRAYLSHTRLDDRYVIRVNIGQTHTEERHVTALWQLITDVARAVG